MIFIQHVIQHRILPRLRPEFFPFSSFFFPTTTHAMPSSPLLIGIFALIALVASVAFGGAIWLWQHTTHHQPPQIPPQYTVGDWDSEDRGRALAAQPVHAGYIQVAPPTTAPSSFIELELGPMRHHPYANAASNSSSTPLVTPPPSTHALITPPSPIHLRHQQSFHGPPRSPPTTPLPPTPSSSTGKVRPSEQLRRRSDALSEFGY